MCYVAVFITNLVYYFNLPFYREKFGFSLPHNPDTLKIFLQMNYVQQNSMQLLLQKYLN